MAKIYTNHRTFTDTDCLESGWRDGRDGIRFYPCTLWELAPGDRLRGYRVICAEAYSKGYRQGRALIRIEFNHFPETGDTRFDSIIESEIERFNFAAKRYAGASVKEMNGDYHSKSTNTADKMQNAIAWGIEAARYAVEMKAIAKRWGFHHLDFGVGLYPTLQKTESDTGGSVHFPYSN